MSRIVKLTKTDGKSLYVGEDDIYGIEEVDKEKCILHWKGGIATLVGSVEENLLLWTQGTWDIDRCHSGEIYIKRVDKYAEKDTKQS